MTDRSVTHDTFVVERTYDASPAHVFAACSDPAIKTQWFGAPDTAEGAKQYTLDFRVGGEETNSGVHEGRLYGYRATIADIVPDERIVSTYEMTIDGTRMSVSVATLQLAPEGDGTRLTYTEQLAILDGLDKVEWREQGTRGLFDALDSVLQRETAASVHRSR